MTNKEWAETVTADNLHDEIIERLSDCGYEEGIEVLTILANRANGKHTGVADPAMERRITFFLECHQAMYAVHRIDPVLYPDHAETLAQGKAALAKVWDSPKKQAAYDQEKAKKRVWNVNS